MSLDHIPGWRKCPGGDARALQALQEEQRSKSSKSRYHTFCWCATQTWRCRDLISKDGGDECPFAPHRYYLMESCFKWLIDVGVRGTSQIEWLDSAGLLQLYMRHFTHLVSMLVLISRLSLTGLFDLMRSQEETSLNRGHDSTKLPDIMHYLSWLFKNIGLVLECFSFTIRCAEGDEGEGPKVGKNGWNVSAFLTSSNNLFHSIMQANVYDFIWARGRWKGGGAVDMNSSALWHRGGSVHSQHLKVWSAQPKYVLEVFSQLRRLMLEQKRKAVIVLAHPVR